MRVIMHSSSTVQMLPKSLQNKESEFVYLFSLDFLDREGIIFYLKNYFLFLLDAFARLKLALNL